LLSEQVSNGCPARLLCYLWAAKLQVQAAALIQQNTADPLQCWDFYFSPKAQPLAMHFMLFFQYDSHLVRHTDCSGVSVALVKPEQEAC